MLQSALQPSASCTSLSSDTTHAASTSSFSMPLRRMLKQGYMSTGNVDQRDGAVVSYLYKLQEHRKVCVCEGRYEEARVTAGGFAYWRFMKHTHTHTRTHTHRHTHILIHTHTRTHTHTHSHTYKHTFDAFLIAISIYKKQCIPCENARTNIITSWLQGAVSSKADIKCQNTLF